MNVKLNRLKEISAELHTLANSLAGDTTGTVAATLHGAVGIINNAARMLETGITAEDKKNVLRRHFKNQVGNEKMTDAEIEELVELFSFLI
jgi:hypothetical protein